MLCKALPPYTVLKNNKLKWTKVIAESNTRKKPHNGLSTKLRKTPPSQFQTDKEEAQWADATLADSFSPQFCASLLRHIAATLAGRHTIAKLLRNIWELGILRIDSNVLVLRSAFLLSELPLLRHCSFKHVRVRRGDIGK
jgi:hypothetical protein